jgi:hypothetical protein
MFHLSVPGTTRSGFPVIIEADDIVVEHLYLSNTNGYNFGIDLMGPEQFSGNGTSAYLLNETQYSDYMSGTPLNETDALITLIDGGRNSIELSLTEDLDLYMIFINEGDSITTWQYYYYILPTTFYPTFIVAFSGAFITILGFAAFYEGWKRWFITAVGFQSIFFLVRVFTLSTYSLNLPDIFWDLIHIELYNDYQFFYLSWIPNLWEGAWAYSLDLAVYLYPPLWIYTVGLFGSIPSWLPGLVLFTFNAATGIVIYNIGLKLTDDEAKSKFIMILYMLNPFTLFYGSFMWLNPTPYVFFVTLSFYLALSEKEEFAVIALAIATLYKQFAVIFFPILIILFVKRKADFNIKGKLVFFLKHTIIYSGVVGLVSLPFLIVSPDLFLNQMFFANTGNYDRLVVFIPENWMTVHANTFFLWLGFPSWFTDFIALLLINYVFLILCGVLIYGGFMFFNSTSFENGEKKNSLFMKAILWAFIAVLSVQLFYPRGSYKFYLLALTPFLVLLFDYKDLDLKSRMRFKFQRHHLFGMIISWAVFLCFRFVYFWLLGIWVIFYLIRSNVLRQLTNPFSRSSKMGERSLSELEEIYSE